MTLTNAQKTTLELLLFAFKVNRYRPTTRDEVSDERALGEMMAIFLKWDPDKISNAVVAMLHDANMHGSANLFEIVSDALEKKTCFSCQDAPVPDCDRKCKLWELCRAFTFAKLQKAADEDPDNPANEFVPCELCGEAVPKSLMRLHVQEETKQ